MKCLLLVDDDPHFVHMLARVLTRRGFDVTTATTAQEARHHLDRFQPDYAVVDMKLEYGSGLDLIQPLRACNDSMRIVVLTGYASIATTVEAIKRGADNYLAKPVEIDVLVSTLKDMPIPEVMEHTGSMSLRRLEWEHIQRVLEQHDGNISATARTLGMHRRTLQRKLAQKPARR
ncbi:MULTISPECIES: response regulator transcription factor [Pseudomonadota]|uniref:response regulator transcription factor n=1 Tax=Pseudomonadota TaxID=1224 RepID=UPI0032667B66